MEYIEHEYRRVIEEKNSFLSIVELSVHELEDEIRNMIKHRWLTGASVDGGKIGEYSNSLNRSIKLLVNPLAGGSVDLTLTGALGDSIELVKNDSGNYEIISSDSKYFEIGNKYGFEEFGLTDQEMSLIMTILGKTINNRINNKLNIL